jgi:hypothetical protein
MTQRTNLALPGGASWGLVCAGRSLILNHTPDLMVIAEAGAASQSGKSR